MPNGLLRLFRPDRDAEAERFLVKGWSTSAAVCVRGLSTSPVRARIEQHLAEPVGSEGQARPAEVYGADVSRRTVFTSTGKILEGMAERQNRPPDAVRPGNRFERVRRALYSRAARD